jgi:prepilin peptidase CpaA
MPGSPSLSQAVCWALVALVMAAGVLDLRMRRIPNWLTGSGIALGLALNGLQRGPWRGLRFSLAGMLLALGVYLLLYALRAMGAGDGKLMAAVGALTGWQNWFGIFLITSILGGVAALFFALARGRLKKTLWNVGFVLAEMKKGRPAYLANEELDVRGAKGLRLPHGAVIAAATLIYLSLASKWR